MFFWSLLGIQIRNRADRWRLESELYIIVYDAIHGTGDVDPTSVATEKPLFAALSLDAKIHNGDWRMIGNVTSNLAHIPQPVFKVNEGGQVFLESRDRSITRPVSPSEAKALRSRTVVAPIRLENALKAWGERSKSLEGSR